MEEFEESHYKICCEYFEYVQSESDNTSITIEETEGIFTILLSEGFKPMYMNNTEIIQGIEFYKIIFDKVIKIKTYQEIIDTVEFFLFVNADSPYLASHYNIIQYLMKITIHLIWQLVYDLAPWLRSTPEEAIQDILDPVKTSQYQMEKIIEYIKNKRG